MIDEDMRAIIDSQHLCFAATVTPNGRPNLSPKGTIRVWDENHIYFLDIASPNTRRNIEKNPWIEVNVVDPISRRGYRLLGRAELHCADDVFDEATKQIFAEEETTYPVSAVVLISVERALPIYSPGYIHISDEYAMRKMWKERRTRMENKFESHIAKQGPYRPASN
jgi:hypothetical protein